MLWKSSSPWGPGPSCTQSRPSRAAARACSVPFPAGMPSSQPAWQGLALGPLGSLGPPAPPFLRHFSKASASVRRRSSKKSGSRRATRARRRLSRAPCRVLALGDEERDLLGRPHSGGTWCRLSRDRVQGLAGGQGTSYLQGSPRTLSTSPQAPPAGPAHPRCPPLQDQLVSPACCPPREPPLEFPQAPTLSPRLPSAVVLRRLGHSLVLLRDSLPASSSLEPESAGAWVLLRAPGEVEQGTWPASMDE